ncbi:MAG: hypothetical protein IJ172_02215 [Ruminococcus sp.]|nr:hypothetical protein [Ruminococcus sp.]
MGKFGDMLNNIRAGANEAAQKRKAEQQALHERMKQYYRGYDVFPDEVNTQYTDWVRRSLIKGLVIKSLILAALIALGVTAFGAKAYDVFPVYMIGGFVALILLLFEITDISLLTRFLKGNYDCFGAMVTNTRVESHTSTDSDGNTTTTYDYYVSLNGIECEVDSKQYRKAAVGQYMHFVRLKAKYRKNDRFYFFPCSEDEEYYLIGHHNPSDEPRLYRAEKGSSALTALSVLCLLGSFGTLIWAILRGSTEFLRTVWILPAGLLTGSLVLAVINKIVGLNKDRKKLEEMKRRHFGE